jgi:hypothetical protein
MPTATKSKATKTKAKAEPKAPKAVTKLDGMVDVTEMIEIWNGMSTHPNEFFAKIDVLQGKSATVIQKRVDADYQCRPMHVNGSFDRDGIRGSIPDFARCGKDLYGDRHEWSLEPGLIAAEESGTGDW